MKLLRRRLLFREGSGTLFSLNLAIQSFSKNSLSADTRRLVHLRCDISRSLHVALSCDREVDFIPPNRSQILIKTCKRVTLTFNRNQHVSIIATTPILQKKKLLSTDIVRYLKTSLHYPLSHSVRSVTFYFHGLSPRSGYQINDRRESPDQAPRHAHYLSGKSSRNVSASHYIDFKINHSGRQAWTTTSNDLFSRRAKQRYRRRT